MCERCKIILKKTEGHGPLYRLVLDTIQDSDMDVNDHLRGEGDCETAELWETFSAASVKTLESLSEPIVEQFRGGYEIHPGLWRIVIEDYYVRELMNNVPSIAARVQGLRPLVVGETPTETVRQYLEEATRCFVYGFFQATAALSRSILEATIDECLRGRALLVPDNLKEKINESSRSGLLTSENVDRAHHVRRVANRVLHDEPTSEQEALHVLLSVRRILRALYGQETPDTTRIQ